LLLVTSEKNAANSDVKKPSLNYEALSRHGYSSGLSIVHVPTSQGQVNEQDWSSSVSKRKNEGRKTKETYEDKGQTQQLVNDYSAIVTTTNHGFSKGST
jgi:hypothetical protein